MEEIQQKKKKNVNPRKTANFFSALTFWWMIPIFRKGYKRDLDTSDLFEPLQTHRSEELGTRLEATWAAEQTKKKGASPSLTRVLIRVFGPNLALYGLLFAFNELCIKMLQPIALGYLVLNYSSSQETDVNRTALYSTIIIMSSVMSILIYYPSLMATFHVSLKLKVACASLIYRKALRLNKASFQTVTAGHIVNLLSADLNSIDLICFFCHNLWIGPLVTVVATIIMYQEIGASAFLGVFIILIIIPFQAWLTKIYASLKRRGAANTDERLEFMNEIIKGIQVIKMYAWEEPFTKLVAAVRRKEVLLIKYAMYIKGLHLAFTLFRTRSAIFGSILAYVLSGNILTAQKVYVVTACFNTMRHTMTDFFSFAIEQAAVARVSVKRIERFLLQDEISANNNLEYKDLHINGTSENKDDSSQKPKVILKNVTAKWSKTQLENTLSKIDLEVTSGGFTAIIGAVGCGKTSLLNVILQELDPIDGKIDIRGTISYASQEPWLFTANIRQNIIFGHPYMESRYNEVIKICSLQNDFSSFQYGDKTLVGDRGISLSGGQKIRINLARAIYKEADIYLLDDPFSALDTKVSNEIFNNCIKSFLKDKICILITHQHQYLERAQKIILLGKGEIKAQGTYEELKNDIWNYTEVVNNSRRQSVASVKGPLGAETSGEKVGPQVAEEQRRVGKVSADIYKAYFLACGNSLFVFGVFLMFLLAQLSASAGDYFLGYWVNLEQTKNINATLGIEDIPSTWDNIRKLCIYSYSSITTVTILVTLASCFMFYTLSTRASMSLHNGMFTSILRATMRFFNTNPQGRIMNRFSKDIEVIDVLMPYGMINCVQSGLSIVGVVTIVAIVNPWLIIPTIVAFCLLYILRNIFLTVSSNLKRLEGTTRSPVLSYVTTSLQGLTTIRAFKAQSRLQAEFDNNQDVHTSARFLCVASARMFAIWLETVCVTYLALVVFSFLIFGAEYGGNVGLAITQVMSMMGLIQWGIRQSSELENHMTSVERVVEYRDLEEIEPSENISESLPPQWPQNGKIEFHNVYLSYDPLPTSQAILKNLTFTIEPKQKVGIIGRTGSGKSSIINALFQLSYTKGSIIIDDININRINLHDLRSKISIIPQEPILFSGTIRKNLDPFDEYDDSKLWRVLKEVNLTEEGDLKDGLESKISENGSNFSVGQKQLICLARAIVRNNKILILDEATANIDPETDNLIQKTIKEKFVDCTVLTVAHRLENIMDCDIVLAMEEGVIKECDQPFLLLQDSNSYLSRLLKEHGHSLTAKFTATAKKFLKKIPKRNRNCQLYIINFVDKPYKQNIISGEERKILFIVYFMF